MNKYLLLVKLFIFLFLICRCTEQNNDQSSPISQYTPSRDYKISKNSKDKKEHKVALTNFLSDGYILFDTIYGDLNNDGMEDCVLITKGTDKTKIVKNEYRGQLDRNRRGIIVLLNYSGKYKSIINNKNCFSSENEDGGVYFPPEMYIEIEKGKLFIHYTHGRYGYWRYSFRLNQNDFELIGYDQSDNRGPIASRIVSMNFLTRKKQIKENINFDSEDHEDEVFKERWENIKTKKVLLLSEINDFDNLDFSNW